MYICTCTNKNTRGYSWKYERVVYTDEDIDIEIDADTDVTMCRRMYVSI